MCIPRIPSRLVSAPVLGPPRMHLSRCLLLRKAPRGRRQRRGHTSVDGGARTTSQGRRNTFVVVLSMINAGAPGVGVGRLSPRVNLSCPLLTRPPPRPPTPRGRRWWPQQFTLSALPARRRRPDHNFEKTRHVCGADANHYRGLARCPHRY